VGDHSFIVSGSIERAAFFRRLAEEVGDEVTKKGGKKKR
jgi:hypothetical protein